MGTRQECMYLIKQLHDNIEKKMNQALSKHDLTMLQMGALLRLHREKQGYCTMKEFEQILHLAQSTTVGVVKRLEQKEYVQTTNDKQDRRIKHVQITKKGLDLCTYAEQEVRTVEEQLFKNLEEEEVQTLIAIIKKMGKEVDDT